MIAKLTTSGGWVAILGDDGRWTCEQDALFAETLNIVERFSPRLGYSPALGAYGYAHAHAAQEAFGGELWTRPIEHGPEEPDIQY